MTHPPLEERIRRAAPAGIKEVLSGPLVPIQGE